MRLHHSSTGTLICRHVLQLAAILCLASPIPCNAQTLPAASQPAGFINDAAIALAKLPRYNGAPVPNADRTPDTHLTLVALQRITPQYSVDAVPFKTALDNLARDTGLNFGIQWAALAKAGIDRDTKVSLALNNVTYHKILTLLLASLSQPENALAYQVKDGIVIVSTQAVLDARREFIPFALKSYVTVFFNANIPDAQQDQEAADLLDLIQHSIAPDDWKADKNTIANFHNTFIVSAPAAIQEQIAQLLADVQSPAKPPKTPGMLVQSSAHPIASKVFESNYPDEVNSAPLRDAIKQIQATVNINFFVDWPTLAAAGIKPETQTTINPKAGSMKGRPIGYVLQQTLLGLADKSGAVDFTLDDEGIVIITTTAKLAAQTGVGTYDLRDWIKHEQFKAYKDKPTADDLINPVIENIKKTIAPDTWGKSSSIENFQGILIINATAKNHRAIFEQLSKLVKF